MLENAVSAQPRISAHSQGLFYQAPKAVNRINTEEVCLVVDC